MDFDKIGKYLCFILRHHPEKIGITLDEHGWADVDELLAGISERCPLCREQLEEIVRTDAKSRYSFSADGQLIRCNQGHSIPVDVELEQVLPPEFLWHGTAERFLPAIFQEGLRRMSRLYVHLSATPEIAQTVGARHGKPVVLRVQTGKMAEDGYAFYRSVNGVWLTEAVPLQFRMHSFSALSQFAPESDLLLLYAAQTPPCCPLDRHRCLPWSYQ